MIVEVLAIISVLILAASVSMPTSSAVAMRRRSISGSSVRARSAVKVASATLSGPALAMDSRCRLAAGSVPATSSATGLPIAVAGAVGFVLTGWNAPDLPPGSTGYLYWPALAGIAAASLVFAPLGAWLAHTLPVDTLRRFFAIFLAVLGVRMLLG